MFLIDLKHTTILTCSAAQRWSSSPPYSVNRWINITTGAGRAYHGTVANAGAKHKTKRSWNGQAELLPRAYSRLICW